MEFPNLKPGEHFDAYFGLLAAPGDFFGRPVDLRVAEAVRDIFFGRRLPPTVNSFMRPECRKHLEGIRRAADLIEAFATARSFDDFLADAMLRSAVERQFAIIGAALTRIRRDDAAVLERIADHRAIVASRNILIHGYDTIDDRIVWDAVTVKLYPASRR